MKLVRIGIVNADATVGAVASNTAKAIRYAADAASLGSTVAVFPEQFFGGYPAEDLVQSPEFVASQWGALQRFADETSEHDCVFVIGHAVEADGFVYNANAVVHRGCVLGIVPKEHLPTYSVFYEKRVFTAGTPGLYREIGPVSRSLGRLASDGTARYMVPFGDLMFEFPFGTMATCICEDTWVPDGPLARRAIALLQIVTNASPARQGVLDTRRQMLATRSADHECTLAAAYYVGANDSLVFDGGGYVFQNGQLAGEADHFQEGVTVFDVDLDRTERMRKQNTTWRARQETSMRQGESFRRIGVPDGPQCRAEVSREFAERFTFLPNEPEARAAALDYMAEVAINGLKGYFEKTGVFDRILIALSGGWDSALTLLLAHRYAMRKAGELPVHERNAFVKDFITCVSMPTRFNSDQTRSIARSLAAELGVTFIEHSIQEAFELEAASLKTMLKAEPNKTVLGNIQARIRGERMWNLSNMTRGLWLQTGNMSEKSVGYTTVGGDLMGAYSLIGNIPKTVVMELAAHLGRVYDIKAVELLTKTRASAELAEGQFDEDELMPFPVLDLCFLLFAGELYSPADMYRIMRARWSDAELCKMRGDYKPGMFKDWIARFLSLFKASIFKWVQSPQAVHHGSLDLDRERALQIPVVWSGEYLKASIEEMRKLPD